MRRAPPSPLLPQSDLRLAAAAESERAIGLARRLGKRLRHQLNLLDKGTLPDVDWREVWRDYVKAVGELGRLAAAPEIGGPHSEKPAGMTDEEYNEELEAIAVGVLRRASTAERRALIDQADGTIAGDPDPERERLS